MIIRNLSFSLNLLTRAAAFAGAFVLGVSVHCALEPPLPDTDQVVIELPLKVSLCEIAGNLSKFDGKLVASRARVFPDGSNGMRFDDNSCSELVFVGRIEHRGPGTSNEEYSREMLVTGTIFTTEQGTTRYMEIDRIDRLPDVSYHPWQPSNSNECTRGQLLRTTSAAGSRRSR